MNQLLTSFMKITKTRNLLFSLLIFVSLISFYTVECIDNKIYDKSKIELKELGDTKDKLIMKFEVFTHFVDKMIEIVRHKG